VTKLAELRRGPARPEAVNCEFRMRNGDVVKGEFLGDAVGFETEHGLLEIPASDILFAKIRDEIAGWGR